MERIKVEIVIVFVKGLFLYQKMVRRGRRAKARVAYMGWHQFAFSRDRQTDMEDLEGEILGGDLTVAGVKLRGSPRGTGGGKWTSS